MSELTYLKGHAIELLEECTDIEQIRLIRALLIENEMKIVKVDDTAQITINLVMK